MVWYTATMIARLRDDFNRAFPNRAKGADGTIGDTAHQGSSSGHNPDDTPGSRSESSDADSKPEVRALDITTDLRDPGGRTMESVIQAILRTPADRDRFRYIIFNRRIWRKANGYKQESYTGTDTHTGHAHCSGDPDHDENDAPFTSVIGQTTGDDVDLNDQILDGAQGNTGFPGRTVRHVLGDTQARLGFLFEAPGSPGQTVPGVGNAQPAPGSVMARLAALPAAVAELRALIGAVAEKVDLDPAELAAVSAAARAGAAAGAGSVDAAAVVALIKADPEFRALIVGAVNAAEDS